MAEPSPIDKSKEEEKRKDESYGKKENQKSKYFWLKLIVIVVLSILVIGGGGLFLTYPGKSTPPPEQSQEQNDEAEKAENSVKGALSSLMEMQHLKEGGTHYLTKESEGRRTSLLLESYEVNEKGEPKSVKLGSSTPRISMGLTADGEVKVRKIFNELFGREWRPEIEKESKKGLEALEGLRLQGGATDKRLEVLEKRIESIEGANTHQDKILNELQAGNRESLRILKILEQLEQKEDTSQAHPEGG